MAASTTTMVSFVMMLTFLAGLHACCGTLHIFVNKLKEEVKVNGCSISSFGGFTMEEWPTYLLIEAEDDKKSCLILPNELGGLENQEKVNWGITASGVEASTSINRDLRVLQASATFGWCPRIPIQIQTQMANLVVEEKVFQIKQHKLRDTDYYRAASTEHLVPARVTLRINTHEEMKFRVTPQNVKNLYHMIQSPKDVMILSFIRDGTSLFLYASLEGSESTRLVPLRNIKDGD